MSDFIENECAVSPVDWSDYTGDEEEEEGSLKDFINDDSSTDEMSTSDECAEQGKIRKRRRISSTSSISSDVAKPVSLNKCRRRLFSDGGEKLGCSSVQNGVLDENQVQDDNALDEEQVQDGDGGTENIENDEMVSLSIEICNQQNNNSYLL